MTKHTPGPWEVLYKAKYDEWYVTVPASDSSMRVNIFPDGVPGDEPGEAEANARLIAAAPDLLAAVLSARRAFLNILEFGLMPSKKYDPDTQKLIDQMHEAIVKATGSAMPGK